MLDRVAACRYGIHVMKQEHFGIALAEMVRLGLVCFAHNDGGSAEILGGDRRLLFDSPEEAVAKICRVLQDTRDLPAIRAGLANQAKTFSAERFMAEFREACINATVTGAASLPHRGDTGRLAPAA